jgi:hypothetical protein
LTNWLVDHKALAKTPKLDDLHPPFHDAIAALFHEANAKSAQ